MNSQISSSWLQTIKAPKSATGDHTDVPLHTNAKKGSFERIWDRNLTQQGDVALDIQAMEQRFEQQVEQAKQHAYEQGIAEGKKRALAEFDGLRKEHETFSQKLQEQLHKKLALIEAHHMHYWLQSATQFSLTLIEHLFKEKTSQPAFWLSALDNMVQRYPLPTPTLYIHASSDVYRLLEPHLKLDEKMTLLEKKDLPIGTLEVESNQGGYSFELSALLDQVISFIHEHPIPPKV